jgi:hypothetical protein
MTVRAFQINFLNQQLSYLYQHYTVEKTADLQPVLPERLLIKFLVSLKRLKKKFSKNSQDYQQSFYSVSGKSERPLIHEQCRRMTTDSSSALSERPVVRHKRVQRDC